MPRILPLVFSLLLGGAAAETIQLGGADCTVTDGELNCNGNCPTGKIVVPDSVTAIAQEAFKDCIALTSVDLSTGYKERWHGIRIDRFGDSAFKGCTALETVIFNRFADNFGQDVFDGCPLKHVHYLGRTEKPYWSLIDCTGDCIEHYDEKKTVDITGTTNGKCKLSTDRKILEGCNEFSEGACPTGDIVIPKEVRGIKEYIFDQCSEINSIIFPDSLEYVSGGMFDGYEGSYYNDITSISILSGLGFTRGTWNPFYRLKNLKIVTYRGAHKPDVRRAFTRSLDTPNVVPLPTCDSPDCTEYFSECAAAKTPAQLLQDLQQNLQSC